MSDAPPNGEEYDGYDATVTIRRYEAPNETNAAEREGTRRDDATVMNTPIERTPPNAEDGRGNGMRGAQTAERGRD